MSFQKTVASPCLGICELGEDDLCVACYRSGFEISQWGALSDDEKLEVWRLIRERERGASKA